jgi:3-oxoacyl-[acyl-carrier protein] reductase
MDLPHRIPAENMTLQNKVAVIYGGGGAIGAAVACAFAAEGARVFLSGRTKSKLNKIAKELPGTEVAVVDALDEKAVEKHADEVARRAGGIDIAFNAIGIAHVQGVPLLELPLADYWHPVQTYLRTNFITSKAVARHMVKRGGGVILLITTVASRMPGPGFMGHSVACAGVEGMTRHLAGELGGSGVRVACIRSHAIPQTLEAGSHAVKVFGKVAKRAGLTTEQMLAGAASGTLLKRLPTLAQLAGTAVFLASGRAGAITGAVVNHSAGMVLD